MNGLFVHWSRAEGCCRSLNALFLCRNHEICVKKMQVFALMPNLITKNYLYDHKPLLVSVPIHDIIQGHLYQINIYKQIIPFSSSCYSHLDFHRGVKHTFMCLWARSALVNTKSTLNQVMTCCLRAPSHYLNQCWVFTKEVLWHPPKSKHRFAPDI